MSRVAINGLGRIGRATLKVLAETPDLELVAINDLVPATNLAYLIRYDTVYGRSKKTVQAEDGRLRVGEIDCQVLSEKEPANLPWKKLGIDLVFECTGLFRKGNELEKHLKAGAGQVVLSAPAKSDDIKTIVNGVNDLPEKAVRIVSCASCTTNCIAPCAEVIDRRIGVAKAAMTTVHAYTSTQSIVDGPSKKVRRGRAAAVNLVPTSTGAAQATAKVVPSYENRFDGVAIRCPVPVGSISDITFVTKRRTSIEEVNDIFREEAASERYQGILGISEDSIVSSDIIGDPRASVVDLEMTRVIDGDLVKVMSWYDNEWGYTSQMVRLALRMLGHPVPELSAV